MDSTQRFSNRVEYYVRYRPGYPQEAVTFLEVNIGLTQDAQIADLGSGTGISTKLFLDHGNRVYGIEPNREMREAAERLLAGYDQFVSVDGTAEATGLPDQSVDIVVAAQAFHWFDRPRTGAECKRILRHSGWAVLLWNERQTDRTPFLRGFEDLLLRCATDYRNVDHARLGRAQIAEFYGHDDFGEMRFPNRQVFDYESLKGRVYSASYCPLPGSPNHEPMMRGLQDLFERFQENGTVAFEYDTRLYYGHVGGG